MHKEEDFYNHIDESWAHTQSLLVRAIKDRTSPLRTGNIAYIEGHKPQIRTVVLRHVSDDLTQLGFHTDYRSPKVRALLENPNIQMHFYAPSEKTQLIAEGSVQLHYKDDMAQAAWDKTQILSRRCYLSEESPSTISAVPTSGFPDEFKKNNQTEQDTLGGYDNFCVVHLNITHWDRLYLSHTGNRRIAFSWDQKQEKFNAEWLVP